MSTQNVSLLIGILVLCAVFPHTCLTVGILLNVYSVTDCTHYIMSVSGQCTFVFQWSLWEHVALHCTNYDNDPLHVSNIEHSTCDSACL